MESVNTIKDDTNKLPRYKYSVFGTDTQNKIRIYICNNEVQARELASLDGLDIIKNVTILGETKQELDLRLKK